MCRTRIGRFALLCALLPACDLDAAVFVEPTVEGASAAISASGLVTGLSGEIDLNLHLGPRASGPGDVTLRSISLTNADRSETLVEAVGAVPNPVFPVTVGVDSDVAIRFDVPADENLLDADAMSTLCSAGDLVYVIVLEDALRGGTVSAASNPVTPTGCP